MTGFSLIPLSQAAGAAYEMLRDMPSESGYANPAYGMEKAEYLRWAADGGQIAPSGSEAENPVQSYVLLHEGTPVAVGRLRLSLNEDLERAGGHISYAVPAALRGRGYAQMLLHLLVQKAGESGVRQVLVTIYDHNLPSIRVAEKCGGVLSGRRPGWCYYVIDTKRPLMDERILACMESAMGIRVRSARPVLGGYLNAKWRVQSSLGALLVKQYSMTRFDPERLKALSWALAHQLQVQNVLPTARLIPHQGKALLNPAKGVYFVVMRYARGHTLETGRPTPVQMMDLGRVCARMHRAMRPLPGETPADGLPDGRALEENLTKLEALAGQRARLQALARAQRAMLAQRPPCPGPAGMAHRDFARDNVLFGAEGVRAVLDFDRARPGWPLLDVARAVMSFCFDGQRLERPLVRAFLTGYRRVGKLSRRDLLRGLRLLCRVETLYWLTPDCLLKDQAPKVERFVREIEFLSLHYDELERLIL